MGSRTRVRAAGLAVGCGVLLLTQGCAVTPAVAPSEPSSPAPPPAPVPTPRVALPAPPPVDEQLVMARSALGECASEHLDDADREAVARVVVAAQREDGLPTLLVLALIEQESLFDPDAVGPRGAVGLMQVRPFVAAAVARRRGIPFEGRSSLFDPALNVRIGAKYLAELQGQFGSHELALAAYNKGPTRVRRELRRGRSPGQAFVSKVMGRYQRYRALYEASLSAGE